MTRIYKSTLILQVLLLVFSYRVGFAQSDSFYIQAIPCVDTVSKQEIEELEKVVKRAIINSDNRQLAREAVPFLQDAANKGNILAVSTFGIFKFGNLAPDKFHQSKGQLTWAVSDEYKDEVIEAFSYIYISQIDDWARKISARTIKAVHSDDSIYVIPKEWIEQAKANSASWKSHCGF